MDCTRIKFIFFYLFLITSSICIGNPKEEVKKMEMYFATVTDTEHFTWTINLISSIHRYNFNELREIGVFDIGLKPEERDFFNTLAKVHVYDVEKVNPYMTQNFNTRLPPDLKLVRGWYSWKPVVFKQSLDMYPYVFYIDSGVTIRADLTPIFEKIIRQNYFFLESVSFSTLGKYSTRTILEKFGIYEPYNRWMLDKPETWAAFNGLTRNMYRHFVLPLYQLSFNIKNFEDDGTSELGFGCHRHDQTLITIYARKLQLFVDNPDALQLRINGQESVVNSRQFFVGSRENFNLEEAKKFLRYKGES